LNVRGINSKINNGCLQDLIKQYDIIGLTETLSNNFDTTVFENHYILMGDDKEKLMGTYGLVFLILKNLTCSVINPTNKSTGLWAKLSNVSTGDIKIGLYYVPPENSKYWNSEAFQVIENEILDLANTTGDIIIMGDFNARTAALSDFVNLDDESTIALKERLNKDKVVNNNGKQLLDLCKTIECPIINGRYGLDGKKGDYTCYTHNGKSTIDYFLADLNTCEKVTYMEVLSFDPAYSDVHAPITMTITYTAIENEPTPKQEPKSDSVRLKWDSNTSYLYPNSFSHENIVAQRELIQQQITLRLSTTDDKAINSIYDGIKNLLYDSAKASGAIRTVKQRKSKPSQPWFDTECQEQKTIFRRICKQACAARDRKRKISAYKAYNGFINKKRKLYTKTFDDNLRDAKKHPKEFWKIINGLNGKKEETQISLENLTTHFTCLNEAEDNDTSEVTEDKENNEWVNHPFTYEEVVATLKRTKNGKACGTDELFPELIKYAPTELIKLMTDFFNLVLKTGKVPDEWARAIIHPIYKKGPKQDCNNYRGISLLNAMGKLFTAVVNRRLSRFLEGTGTIGPEQAGFRENHSTTDHILVLHSLVQMYLAANKRLYCAFVDYEKAFDTVKHALLWKKLLAVGINGKILSTIKDLYSKAKACVRVNGKHSTFFNCKTGVRQGDNLSALLFVLYINDFEEHIRRKCKGLVFAAETAKKLLSDPDTEVFLKLFVLLYADDTILLAETETDLQAALDATETYCKQWELRVNTKKTKVIIFSKGKVRKVRNFSINGTLIERVPEFCYLGTIFRYNGTFQATIKYNVDKARKALFSLFNKTAKVAMDIDTMIKLFDSMIAPILLYGCEIWGYEKLDLLEVFHRKFLRRLLQVHKRTANCMVYGELGRYEMKYVIWKRMANYWLSTQQTSNKLAHAFSSIMYKSITQYKWTNMNKKILDDCGISSVYDFPKHCRRSDVNAYLKHYLADLTQQLWHTNTENNSLCITYKLYKNTPYPEPYLKILNKNNRKFLSQFRCASLKFPHIKAKYNSEILDQCPCCYELSTPDEYHLLMKCEKFAFPRREFLGEYFSTEPSLHKFSKLMNTKNPSVLKSLSHFIGFICET
jgi:hypothetical protein